MAVEKLPTNPTEFTDSDWKTLFTLRSLGSCLLVTGKKHPSSLWSIWPAFDLSNFKDREDFVWQIPNVSVEINVESTFSKVINNYSQSGYSTTSATIGVPGIASGTVEHSETHSHSESFSKETYYSTAMVRVPQLEIAFVESKLKLAESCIDELNKALDKQTHTDQYTGLLAWLQKYGYWVCTKLQLGGLYYATNENEVTSMAQANCHSEDTKVSFKADLSAFDVPVSGGASHDQGSKTCKSLGVEIGNASLSIQLIGGDTAYMKDYPKWAGSMAGNYASWHIINTETLVPIINFIPDQKSRFQVASLIQRFPSTSYNAQYIQTILDEQQKLLTD